MNHVSFCPMTALYILFFNYIVKIALDMLIPVNIVHLANACVA